jgi:hypothetical protein
MLKQLAVLTLSALMLPVVSLAQVSIQIGPPPPVVEHYGPPPHPGYVWQGGYQRWDGHHYAWAPGHWGRPPHPGAVWVAGNYDHRGRGYAYHPGYWR